MLKKIYASFINKLSSPTSALRQVSLVAGGTVIAQTLNVITLPLLSRIYSPADFGVMAVYSSVVAILTELAGLRYYLAIPLPKHTRYAHALVCLSFIIQIAMVSLLTIILFFAGDYLFEKLSLEALIRYKYLIPVGLLTIGGYNIVSQWAIREAHFATLGKTKITQAVGGASAKIALGALGLRPFGLLCGTIIGQCGGIGALLSCLLRKTGQHIRITKKDIFRVLIRYRKFPVYSTMFGLLNTAGVYMPQLFLSACFSTEVTGLYSMAVMLLHVPSIFVDQALGQIFLQRASTAKHNGSLHIVALKAYSLLWKLSCFPILFISIFAPWIFAIALGEEWVNAADFSIMLAPWIAVAFVFSPMSSMYSIQDRQEKAFITEIIYFFMRLSALYIGTISGDPFISVLLFSLSGVCVLLYRLVDILESLGIPKLQSLYYPLKELALAALLTAVPAYFLKRGMLLLAAITSAPAIFIYIVMLYKSMRHNHLV